MSVLSVLLSAVLPVAVVAAVGYVLGRFGDVDVDPLSQITIYVLAPALVFHSLVTTPITGGTVARLFAGVAGFTLLAAAIAELVGRGIEERETTRGAFVLTSSFGNAGNLGIPLAAFAFGAVGRSTAVLYVAAQGVLMYTLGVYVAARGRADSVRGTVGKVFRLPLIYAVAAALGVRAVGVSLPADTAAMQTLKLTGDAAIPVMLLMLGIQLADARTGGALRRVLPATGLRLFVAPVLAVGVALVVGLEGTVGQVFVLGCAAPAAVTPLMLTIEFGRDVDGLSAADFVSTTILVSTLAGLATLTGLIVLLQSGAIL